MGKKHKVVAVVVTYNRVTLLQECINALLKQDCDILIIDNASTDNTAEVIKKNYKDKVIYKNTGKNLGGAGGFNFGLKEAYKLGYDYFWIMDDDCIVQKNSLKELMHADKELKGDYGFLASKILWKDNTYHRMNRPKKTFYKYLDMSKNKMETIEMASFVSILFKRETIKTYGLPIKEFFIWSDDWEYTRRISRKVKCYYVPKSIAIHKSAQNMGAKISTESGDRLERFNYLYRNDMYLYKKEGFLTAGFLMIRIAKHLIDIVLKSKDKKFYRIKIMLSSLCRGIRFNPEIEYVEN